MSHGSSGRRASSEKRSKTVLWFGAAVLFAAGIYFGSELTKPPPRPDFGAPPPAPAVRRGAEQPSSVEPAAAIRPAAPVVETLDVHRQPPPGGGTARIAIVIDDLGRSLRDLEVLAQLDIPLTYAVLPFETHTPQVVATLRERSAEYLCHLPMEAKGSADPGPGALLLGMSREELIAATREALAAVPGAAGVNNHMGSAIAAERDAMSAVLEVLAEEHLYFLDSRTSADTLGYTLARQLGLPAGERQVFLDTDRDPAAIRSQFAELLKVAHERGGAIAIAHPYPETLEILADQVPAAVAQGYEFVTAGSLVDG